MESSNEEPSNSDYGSTLGTSQTRPLPSIGSVLETFRDNNETSQPPSKQTTWYQFRICSEKNVSTVRSMSTLCSLYHNDPMFTLDSLQESSQKESSEGATLRCHVENLRTDGQKISDGQKIYQFNSNTNDPSRQSFTFPIKMKIVENNSTDLVQVRDLASQNENYLKVTHLKQASAESSDVDDIQSESTTADETPRSPSRETGKSENLKSPVILKSRKDREEYTRELFNTLRELLSCGADIQTLSRNQILDYSVNCIQSLQKRLQQEHNPSKIPSSKLKDLSKFKKAKGQEEEDSDETTSNKIKTRCLKTGRIRNKSQNEAEQSKRSSYKKKQKVTIVFEDGLKVKRQSEAEKAKRSNYKKKQKVKVTTVSGSKVKRQNKAEQAKRSSNKKKQKVKVNSSSKSPQRNRKVGITFVDEKKSSSQLTHYAQGRSVEVFFAHKQNTILKSSKKTKETIRQMKKEGKTRNGKGKEEWKTRNGKENGQRKTKIKPRVNAKLSKKESQKLERKAFFMYSKRLRPRLKKEMSACSRGQITELLKSRWQGLCRKSKRNYEREWEEQLRERALEVKSKKKEGQERYAQSKKKVTRDAQKIVLRKRKPEQDKVEKEKSKQPLKKIKKDGVDVVNWVQCDKCENWRILPENVEVNTSKRWFCRMNKDKKHNKCSIPQESYGVPKV